MLNAILRMYPLRMQVRLQDVLRSTVIYKQAVSPV